MHLVEEQMLSSHQVETLRQVQQGMAGEIQAIHKAVQSFSRLDAIVQLDILAHQRGLADAAGSANAYQLFFPLDGVHRIADDIRAYLRDQ